MPSFDAYDQDITAQNNTARSHEAMKNLVEWYGAALRQYVETGTTDGTKVIAKVTAGKIPKADATNIQTKLAKFAGKSEAATVAANVTAYCGKLAKNLAKKAAIDEADAVADVQAGDGDEASELFVDAALQYFRAAMCNYHEGSLNNPLFANLPVRQAALDYGTRLVKAGQMLNDAAKNEAAGDVLEIVAECLLAKALLDLASAELTALQNSGTLPAVDKPKVAAVVAKIAPAQTAADAALGPKLK